MVEKNFQTLFKHWLANNLPEMTTVYELKLEKSPRLSFDRVYDHQVAGLRQAIRKGIYHKIADQPAAFVNGQRVHFGGKKPFDCMFIKGEAKCPHCKKTIKIVEAYVVVMFYTPFGQKEMFFIDIDRWVKEKESSERKSLTEDRARAIATSIDIL